MGLPLGKAIVQGGSMSIRGRAGLGELLRNAVREGNFDAVKVLLGLRAPAQGTGDPNDEPPLFEVPEHTCSSALVAELVRYGAKVNVPFGQTLETPLMRAAAQQRIKTVLALLDKGADKEAVDAHGHTALWHAAGHGYVDVTTCLLEQGAHPRGGTGESALWIAAQKGHSKVVRTLIQNGARKDWSFELDDRLSPEIKSFIEECTKVYQQRQKIRNARKSSSADELTDCLGELSHFSVSEDQSHTSSQEYRDSTGLTKGPVCGE